MKLICPSVVAAGGSPAVEPGILPGGLNPLDSQSHINPSEISRVAGRRPLRQARRLPLQE
jgi:hypothetical protein